MSRFQHVPRTRAPSPAHRPRPPAVFTVPERGHCQLLQCDVAALPVLDETWARPDLFLSTALRPNYPGFYRTYSRIRIQDLRASLAEELLEKGQMLRLLSSYDIGQDPMPPEDFEDALLEIARDVLVAAAAAETTLLQRRLARRP